MLERSSYVFSLLVANRSQSKGKSAFYPAYWFVSGVRRQVIQNCPAIMRRHTLMPEPLSCMLRSFKPPSLTCTLTLVLPASIEFSRSSFSAEDGRCTTYRRVRDLARLQIRFSARLRALTSPAAMRLIVSSVKRTIRPFLSLLPDPELAGSEVGRPVPPLPEAIPRVFLGSRLVVVSHCQRKVVRIQEISTKIRRVMLLFVRQCSRDAFGMD